MTPETALEKIEATLKWDLPAVTTVTRIEKIIREYRMQFDPDYGSEHD